MSVKVEVELCSIWQFLESANGDFFGCSIPTQGIGGRASGKLFTPIECKSKRLYIAIQGRKEKPSKPRLVKSRDFELILKYENKEISLSEAKESWKTSYAGPLIQKIRKMQLGK